MLFASLSHRFGVFQAAFLAFPFCGNYVLHPFWIGTGLFKETATICGLWLKIVVDDARGDRYKHPGAHACCPRQAGSCVIIGVCKSSKIVLHWVSLRVTVPACSSRKHVISLNFFMPIVILQFKLLSFSELDKGRIKFLFGISRYIVLSVVD